MKNIRRKIVALWIFFVFTLMVFISGQLEPLPSSKDIFLYISKNYIEQTGSQNAVSGIYLDYRAFDTLFETLLLMVSVIGIIYFSRHEGDY